MVNFPPSPAYPSLLMHRMQCVCTYQALLQGNKGYISIFSPSLPPSPVCVLFRWSQTPQGGKVASRARSPAEDGETPLGRCVHSYKHTTGIPFGCGPPKGLHWFRCVCVCVCVCWLGRTALDWFVRHRFILSTMCCAVVLVCDSQRMPFVSIS